MMSKALIVQVGARHEYVVTDVFHGMGFDTKLVTTGYNKGLIGTRFFKHRNSGLMSSHVKSLNLIYLPFLFVIQKTNFLGLKSLCFISISVILQLHAVLVILRGNIKVIFGFNGTLWLVMLLLPNREFILDQTMGSRRKMRELQPSLVSNWAYLNSLRESMESIEWRNANRILAASSFVISTVPKKYKNKIRLVPYGIDVQLWQNKPRDVSELIRSIKVVFVGSLIERKGVDILCDIIAKHEIDITFIGDGALKERLETLGATTLGNLPKTSLRNLLGDFDMLILPSRWEGSATVIYEATASGLSVLCSNNSGAPLNLSNVRVLSSLNGQEVWRELKTLSQGRDLPRPTIEDIEFVDNSRYVKQMETVINEVCL